MNKEKHFNWSGLRRSYPWETVYFPFLIIVALSIICSSLILRYTERPLFEVVQAVADIGLTLLPAFMGLVVAAFAITTSMTSKPLMLLMKNPTVDNRTTVFERLASIYSIMILFSVFTILVFTVVKIVVSLELTGDPDQARTMNFIAITCLTTTLLLTLWFVRTLAFQLYNLSVVNIANVKPSDANEP